MNNSDKMKIQVEPEHYTFQYDNLPRFAHYLLQIELVRSLSPDKTLEIGVGTKTVSNYLRQLGLKVDTCDFDERLGPDFVADVRQLPFADGSYDLITACEVLEHLPWEDVDAALAQLHRVSRRNVIISIPYSSVSFELMTRFTAIEWLTGRLFLNCSVSVPRFFSRIKFSGEHHWEMGRRGFPRKKVRAAIEKYFVITRELKPPLNAGDRFFVLEKR